MCDRSSPPLAYRTAAVFGLACFCVRRRWDTTRTERGCRPVRSGLWEFGWARYLYYRLSPRTHELARLGRDMSLSRIGRRYRFLQIGFSSTTCVTPALRCSFRHKKVHRPLAATTTHQQVRAVFSSAWPRHTCVRACPRASTLEEKRIFARTIVDIGRLRSPSQSCPCRSAQDGALGTTA